MCNYFGILSPVVLFMYCVYPLFYNQPISIYPPITVCARINTIIYNHQMKHLLENSHKVQHIIQVCVCIPQSKVCHFYFVLYNIYIYIDRNIFFFHYTFYY